MEQNPSDGSVDVGTQRADSGRKRISGSLSFCRAQRIPAQNVVRRAPHDLALVASNAFMTVAWYGHLKHHQHRAWYVAALLSWGIALFEYLLQVPANRIGFTVLSLGQLKMLRKIITLAVFIPFAVVYMKHPLKLDFLWASLCL